MTTTPLPLNEILLGDCREQLKTLPANSIDSVVTDPPAGIAFMSKDWDNPDAWKAPIAKHGYTDGGDRVAAPLIGASSRNPNCRKCKRHKRGWKDVPGCQCEEPDFDTSTDRLADRDSFITFLQEVFTETYRVLKPGGHMLVWSIPRTSHWTATAIENAGFEIRDCFFDIRDRSPEVRTFLESLSPEQHEMLVRAAPTDGLILHVFGSGFPKSLNVSKEIDKKKGAIREVVGVQTITGRNGEAFGYGPGPDKTRLKAGTFDITAPATDEAKTWEGWGTGLKPAVEGWWLCRKPIVEATITNQVLKSGTGAINIDGARIKHSDPADFEKHKAGVEKMKAKGGINKGWKNSSDLSGVSEVTKSGRWPSHLGLSHSPGCKQVGTEEVAAYQCAPGCPIRTLDEQSGDLKSGVGAIRQKPHETTSMAGTLGGPRGVEEVCYGDSGGASRFFINFMPDPPFLYTGKASKRDKNADLSHLPDSPSYMVANGSKTAGTDGVRHERKTVVKNTHPTVKSQELMTYLVRLITPKGGVCLDPFAGSGSTLVACITEGVDFIGIEKEPEYHAIAVARTEPHQERVQSLKSQRELFEEGMALGDDD